jgi:hypothetical protein
VRGILANMYLEGCFQCDGLLIERGPVKLNSRVPKPQVVKTPSYKPPVNPAPVAPKLRTIQPNRARVNSTNMTLILVGSNFTKTSQIWDSTANKALPTIFSSSTQLCSTGYTMASKPGNYLYYVKDSVSGLKSANVQIVARN